MIKIASYLDIRNLGVNIGNNLLSKCPPKSSIISLGVSILDDSYLDTQLIPIDKLSYAFGYNLLIYNYSGYPLYTSYYTPSGDYGGDEITTDAMDFQISVMDSITISCEHSVIGGYYFDPDNYDWINFPPDGEQLSTSVDLYFGEYQNRSEDIVIEVNSAKIDNQITIHWYADSPWKLMMYSEYPLASDLSLTVTLYNSRPFTDPNSWTVEHFQLSTGESNWERDLGYDALGIRNYDINNQNSASDIYYNYIINPEGENQ